MLERIAAAVADIRSSRSLLGTDEASVKSAVVMRLLGSLGWDPFDLEHVRPEYVVGSRRVDFALRAAGTNRVFIEVKRPSESLHMHEEQLLAYAFAQGVQLAVLTNGTTWWFYLPLSEGDWSQRRFFTVDLLAQEPATIARHLHDLLSREAVVSGSALRTANDVYHSRQKQAKLEEYVPRAWQKLVSDPDETLIELLIDTTEKLCGFRPEIQTIEEFLASIAAGDQVALPHPPAKPDRGAIGPEVSRTPKGPTTVSSNSRRQITGFVLFGKRESCRTWQELLLQVAADLNRRHAKDFSRIETLEGTKMRYYSRNQNELIKPKPIPGSAYFATTYLSSKAIEQRCRDLLALFGHRDEDLQVFVE